MKRPSGGNAAVWLAVIAVAALGAVSRPAAAQPSQPGAIGDASRAAAARAQPAAARTAYTEADVRFMQHMIVHHAQALEMSSLVPKRTARQDIRLLAQRIEVSQEDEIAQMRNWLKDRGEPVPELAAHPAPGRPPHGHDHHAHDPERHAQHHAQGTGHHAHHAHGPQAAGEDDPAQMPGMLSRAEIARLAATTGAEFDRLFLEYMIRHHEGALAMVAELFASEGAAQEPEIFRFASDVDADQRMEITRMRSMLAAAGAAVPSP